MEVVVAAFSAVIALAALVVSSLVARRQTAIQERLAAIEEARRVEEVEGRSLARVTASMAVASAVLGPQLVLRNQGPAVARGVELETSQGPNIPPVLEVDEILPADLQPGQEMKFKVPVAMGDAAMIRVTVRWRDGAGEHEEPLTLQTR